jgi:hypothetical protein
MSVFLSERETNEESTPYHSAVLAWTRRRIRIRANRIDTLATEIVRHDPVIVHPIEVERTNRYLAGAVWNVKDILGLSQTADMAARVLYK